MKLYGAKVSEKYIDTHRKRLKHRYPQSVKYPILAAYHEIWHEDPPKVVIDSKEGRHK